MATTHTRTVLQLYRRLLRLHELLPSNMGQIGRQFVREEFRRHKVASPEYVTSFMREWNDYAKLMEEQVGGVASEKGGVSIEKEGVASGLGRNLSASELNQMSDQQLGQLWELKQETNKPVDPISLEPSQYRTEPNNS